MMTREQRTNRRTLCSWSAALAVLHFLATPSSAQVQESGWTAPLTAVVKLGDGMGQGAPPESREKEVLELTEGVSLVISRSSESLGFLLDTGDERVKLSTIEAAWLPWVLDRFVVGWVEINAQDNIHAAFFEYLHNEGGRKFNDTDTYLRLCVLKELRLAGPCQTFELGKTDIAYHLSLEPSRHWAYLGIDTTGPATMSDSRILTVDADQDGYRDLVLWKKQCRSITPEEVRQRSELEQKQADDKKEPGLPPECELHFQLEEEKALLSYFRPEELAFSESEPIETLSIPERFNWQSLASLGWVAIP